MTVLFPDYADAKAARFLHLQFLERIRGLAWEVDPDWRENGIRPAVNGKTGLDIPGDWFSVSYRRHRLLSHEGRWLIAFVGADKSMRGVFIDPLAEESRGWVHAPAVVEVE